MSSYANGWVYRHSPYRGATFDVHLAIGDVVNDNFGNEFWMSKPRLAAKARVSVASAKTALKVLEDGGFIELLEESGGRNGSRYLFLFPDVPVVYDGGSSTGQPRPGSRKPPQPKRLRPTGQPLAGSTEVPLALVDEQPAKSAVPNRLTDEHQPANWREKSTPYKERTQENPRDQPKKTLAPLGAAAGTEVALPDPKPTPASPHQKSAAQDIVRAWWDAQDPRPVSNFLGVVGVVAKFIAAGYPLDRVIHALNDASVPTTNSMLLELNRDKPARRAPMPTAVVDQWKKYAASAILPQFREATADAR